MGYRAQNTTKVARGNDPETIYMVTSGTHFNAECCFDCESHALILGCAVVTSPTIPYSRMCRHLVVAGADGNSENDCDNRAAFCDGCMEAVYFGSGYGGEGKGPWYARLRQAHAM